MEEEREYTGKFEPGYAAQNPVSLSQALLAPLDAIFKAQIHAARSFLSLLLQIGYPHQPLDEEGRPKIEEGTPRSQEFFYELEVNGKKERRKVSIPALALVPVAPLAVEEASFSFEMRAEWVDYHGQMQDSQKDQVSKDARADTRKRPWFLVSDPISIRGTLAPSRPREPQTSQASTIQIQIKIARVSMPAGLDRLLTSLTQACAVSGPLTEKPEKKE
jgi:hypothetical protein